MPSPSSCTLHIAIIFLIAALNTRRFFDYPSARMFLLAFSFSTIDHWIEAGGALALLGLLLACGLGLPLPEDIPLMVAGALVAKGQMHLATAAIAAWCGIIGGDLILYFLGRKFGMEITKLPFIGKHLTEKRIDRVEKLFEQYGVGVIAVGRLFAGVRGAMVVAAGAIRFNLIKFVITDGLAALFSGGFFLFIGHWLGTKLNEESIKHFKHIFIIVALVAVVVLLGYILWRNRKAVDRMERSFKTLHMKPKATSVTTETVETTGEGKGLGIRD